jgi:hypothetical protein
MKENNTGTKELSQAENSYMRKKAKTRPAGTDRHTESQNCLFYAKLVALRRDCEWSYL